MKKWEVIIVNCIYGPEILGNIEAENFETALELAYEIYDDGGQEMIVRSIPKENIVNLKEDK